MPQVLHGYLQQALKAHEASRRHITISKDGSVHRFNGEQWIYAGRITDAETAEDLKLCQVAQEDH